MAKKKENPNYIKVGNASYHIATVAGYSTFEAFKADMDKESGFGTANAHPALHFAGWTDRDAKLKEVFDTAKAKAPTEVQAPAADPGEGDKGKKKQ